MMWPSTSNEMRSMVLPLIPTALIVADRRLGKDEQTTWLEYKETVAALAVDLAEETLRAIFKRFPET